MATMPFLCNGTLTFQGNLPRVLQVIILKYASCLIPYIYFFSIRPPPGLLPVLGPLMLYMTFTNQATTAGLRITIKHTQIMGRREV